MDCWTQHYPTIAQLDSRTPRCSTIGLLDTALLNNWTVWNSTLRPLDKLDKAQSEHFTVEHSAGQPSDSLTHHSLTIGLLDKSLSNHWTV